MKVVMRQSLVIANALHVHDSVIFLINKKRQSEDSRSRFGITTSLTFDLNIINYKRKNVSSLKTHENSKNESRKNETNLLFVRRPTKLRFRPQGLMSIIVSIMNKTDNDLCSRKFNRLEMSNDFILSSTHLHLPPHTLHQT